MSKMLFDIPRPAEAPKSTTAEIAPKPYKHSIVDSAKTPIESLAAWIGGSNLQVDYYSQIFGKSEELKAFDPDQLNPYQNYHKINRFIIKLQGAFSQDDEGENGRFAITGTAVIPPFPNLVPNVGDAIIADVGEGDAGQFTVTRVRKLSNNHATAWEISFSHDRLVTPQIAKLLDSKVVKESFYQRDYLITGQNAFLASEDYDAMGKLNHHIRTISQMFIGNNFSFANHTLTVPGQSESTYDPYVTRAALKVISSEDVPLLRDICEYNCDDHRIPKFTDVYTAVMKRDSTLIYNTFKEYACITVALLNPSVYQNSVRYSGIRYIIAPYQPNMDNDNYAALNDIISGYRVSVLNPGITIEGSGAQKCPADINIDCDCETVPETIPQPLTPGFDIPKIGNDTYVLSEAFYKKQLIECSLFERCIWNILDNKPLNYTEVFAFCESYPYWGKLEQYYLGPLLILMIRATLRGLLKPTKEFIMSQPTVCQRLFNDLFIVGLPNKFLWGADHLKRIPGLHSEDSDMNRVILNEVTFVPRTIIGMVLLYDKGIEVQFNDRRDMYTAYDLITRHLNRWGEIIAHPLGGRKPPPADELLMLEDFANFIYADASFERDTIEAEGGRTQTDFLSEFFAIFGGRDSMRDRRQGITPSTNIAPQPPTQPGSTIQTAWNNSPWSLISGNSRHSG